MPNTPVQATVGGMPKFNQKAIMQAAWMSYRAWHARQESIHGPRPFNRSEFSFRLQIAWRNAKMEAMTAVERRRVQIESEIEGLKYKSFAINTTPIRQRLQAELSALAA
jgi:hypothetical protein